MNRKNIPKPVTQTTGLSYREVLKIRAVNALQFFPYSPEFSGGVFYRSPILLNTSAVLFHH